MKSLITGSEGFIGRHLKARGELPENTIVHLAARIPKAFDDVFYENLRETVKVCNLAVDNNAYLIFASSCAVYGSNAGFVDERAETKPTTLNGLMKLQCEEIIQLYRRAKGLKAGIFRLFNVYGPGQKENYLIPYLLQCARKMEDVRLNEPHSRRDLVYVSDVVECLAQAAIAKPEGVFNVGSGFALTNIEVAETVFRSLGKEPQIRCESDKGETTCANISKIQAELNWTPKYRLRSGLKQFGGTNDGVHLGHLPHAE